MDTSTNGLDPTQERSGTVSATITEEEASRYDRQMRLWGLEAQQRMRNATVLVTRLRGVATEAIKNIVLAGIGRLIILDGDDVRAEDLGAGFFFRDEDVGSKRLEVAKARIESLNPLVTVEIIAKHVEYESSEFEALLDRVDLVCITDDTREAIQNVDTLCRQKGKLLYAGGSYGIHGYIFCDLGHHEYLAPLRGELNEAPKTVKSSTVYSSFKDALEHKWSGLSKRQTKEVNPALVFSILALWEYQNLHGGRLPDLLESAAELEAIANGLIARADVNKQVLTKIPHELMESLATIASHEFSPVCAIVGGMLGQDILKALGGRDPPIANLFTFDGNTGSGTTVRMNMV